MPALRPYIADLKGYAAVLPVAEHARRLGMAPDDILKLDANENPFGAHPLVLEAVRAELSDPHRAATYPDPQQLRIREAIAAYAGVAPDHVIAGAGADELLDILLRALGGREQRIVISTPAFGVYQFLADVFELPCIAVPRGAGLALDVEAIRAAAPDGNTIVILTSPHNPVGDLFPRDALEELLGDGATVLLDEAYIEFGGESAVDLVAEHPGLVILRTFSKFAGIAGLRLGYAVGQPDLIQGLLKIKQPYNVNVAAEAAGVAAVEHVGSLMERVALVRQARDDLFAALSERSELAPHPSHANFILVDVSRAPVDFPDGLRGAGVLVRTYSDPQLARHIRISAPRPDQLGELLTRIDRALYPRSA